MGGEPVDEAALGPRGLRGDRILAVVDREMETVASAKHPRKWGGLLQCHARLASSPSAPADSPEVIITFPDGTERSHRDAETEDRLSELLGAPVALACRAERTWDRETDRTPPEAPAHGKVVQLETIGLGAPSGTFFDYGPLHLVTTATLERLADARPASTFDVRRFRPNLLLTVDGLGFVEHEWLGRSLAVGPATVRVVDPTPRCVVTTLAQPEGSASERSRRPPLCADRDVLRTIASLNTVESRTLAPGTPMPAVVGVYAEATSDGVIRTGDAVRLLSPREAEP